MPGLFSKVFKKDSTPKKAQNGAAPAPARPKWTDAWQRAEIEPREVQELLHGCTREIKSRALQLPFVLLPFRPASDPSAARIFVRNFFGSGDEPPMTGDRLATELRLAEPLVLCSVMKWCWSRLPGGVVTWDAYELFKEGEHDSNLAHAAFTTFIPIGTADDSRTKIIVDFFDLLATVAAHANSNGFPGRKLSRYAGWWAFEHKDTKEGFNGGYKRWSAAADAACHLFFAYLRSLAPDPVQGALTLPRSLQALLEQTEYPPIGYNILQKDLTKVVMIVDKVSPTPFALLRRTKNFEYRSDDQVLQAFSNFEDPVQALSDECKRILQGIATANDSTSTKLSTSLRDASWSRFEDIGFAETNEAELNSALFTENAHRAKRNEHFQGLRTTAASVTDMGRPTTPSWADFLSEGFTEGQNSGPGDILPPDKQLPPISISQGPGPLDHHEKRAQSDGALSSGELASVDIISMDDVFWWVWITSLAGEETVARKAAFGRCAMIETKLRGGTWLLVEEVVKGAKAEPAKAAYVAEKKSRFGFSRLLSSKSVKSTPSKKKGKNQEESPTTKRTIAPDQHARIKAAAADLTQKGSSAASPTQTDNAVSGALSPERRGRLDDNAQSRTTSVLTLQPVIMNEAAPAMKWANSYDKNEIRSKYLGDRFAGRGSSAIDLPSAENGDTSNGRASPAPPVTAPSSGTNGIAKEASPVPAPAPTSPSVVAPPQTIVKKPVSTQEPTQLPTAPVTPQKNAPQYPKPMERVEPPPRGASIAKMDQFRSGPEYSKQSSAKVADSALATPDASPADSKKLTKRPNVPGRFGSIFGRKKTETENKSPMAEKAMPMPAGGSAVAAARAALEAKAQQASPPARQSVVAKRTSLAEPQSATSEGSKGVLDSTKEQWSPAQAAAIAAPMIIEPTMSAEHAYEPSFTTDSHLDETESNVAEREFSRFDQGPLADAPSYEPEHEQKDSPVSAVTDSPAALEASKTEVRPDSIVSEIAVVPSAPATEAQASEAQARNRALSDERWTQIKKQAADRVAASRASEEQSRMTSNTEDDADSDAEETIESRVARIKARVAELTGNMDVPSPRQH